MIMHQRDIFAYQIFLFFDMLRCLIVLLGLIITKLYVYKHVPNIYVIFIFTLLHCKNA